MREIAKVIYRLARQFTLEMPITKLKAQDEFYAKLENKDGEKSNYKLAKLGERKCQTTNLERSIGVKMVLNKSE